MVNTQLHRQILVLVFAQLVKGFASQYPIWDRNCRTGPGLPFNLAYLQDVHKHHLSTLPAYNLPVPPKGEPN